MALCTWPSEAAATALRSNTLNTCSMGLPSSSSRTGGKKRTKLKVRTVEDVEHDIEKAEARVNAIEEELAEAARNADAAHLTQLSADYEQERMRVEELLLEWEELSKAE